MMLVLYTTVTRIFLFIAPLFRWLGPKFSTWLDTRDQWRSDTKSFVKTGKVVWVHCASVGEFEQARPLIERLKNEIQEVQIVLTFFSSSGFELRKNYELADVVTYIPVDLPSHINPFLDRITPDLVVVVKYELWFNTMQCVKDRSIAMILISAYFTADHWTITFPGILLGRRLAQFDSIFAQDQDTVERLKRAGIDSATVVGDTRVDRVRDNAQTEFSHKAIEVFKGGDFMLVIGSNWASDDELLVPEIARLKNIKVLVVPHELNESQKEMWRHAFQDDMICLSECDGQDVSTNKVFYIDHIGMLSKLYRYADVAYVGGGFGKSVHNTLEAAIYGIPVVFGPNNGRFLEVQKLKEMGVGIEVSSAQELGQALRTSIESEDYRKEVKLKLEGFFTQQTGATEKILGWVKDRLA